MEPHHGQIELYHVIIIALSLLFSVALMFILLHLAQKRYDRHLSQPLLNHEDVILHRLDAAERDANELTIACSVCEFDNLAQSTYCVLCNSKFLDKKNGKNERDEKQIRVKKRRAWTRKVDVEGNCYWYFAKSAQDESSFPGWVLRFTIPDEIRYSSYRAVESIPIVIDVAKSASSLAIPPYSFCVDSELLQLSRLPFPKKYAHFVNNSALLLVPAEVEYLKLSVHRDYVLEESSEHLVCIKEKNIRSVMRINFLDENGVDAGGVHREWFMLLNEKLVDEKNGLFRCTNKSDRSYFINSNSKFDRGEDHLIYFHATGRFIGRALLEGAVLSFHFCVPLLKLILGIPISFSDIEYFDSELYRSLKWIHDTKNVEDLNLDFTVCEKAEGSDVNVVELIPNGQNVMVTEANKLQYLTRRFHYMIFESISDQLYMFMKGIYEIVPPKWLALFDHEELDYILCGTDEIDVEDWERCALVSPSLQGTSTLLWFWSTVREMTNEYRRKLLQFATGSSRVPPMGFKGLTSYDGRLCPFTLNGVTNKNLHYLYGHACFNRIDLPFFKNQQQLKDVIYATLETDIYGFTAD